jgi:hypothetical protein
VGIKHYPSPSIGIIRQSNLSSCFQEIFRSLSIADYRRPTEDFDGTTDGIRLFCFDYDPEIPSRYRQASGRDQSGRAGKPRK